MSARKEKKCNYTRYISGDAPVINNNGMHTDISIDNYNNTRMNIGTPSLRNNNENKLSNNTIINNTDSSSRIELASPIQLRRLQQRETDGQTDRQTIRSSSLSHLEDDARVEEDEEAKRYDENEDESSDDVAVMPVLVDGADADGDVDAVDVVELRVREGDG